MSDVAAATAAQTVQAPPPAGSGTSSGPTLWSHGGFSFKDLLDIVNPLQHLPVIGSVYRYLTGDEPSGGARIIGDSLYGGPIGFGVSVVSTALLDDNQGHDVGERMLAKVFGPRDGDSNPTATAVASTAPATTATKGTATSAMSANQASASANPSSAMMANITAPATMPSPSGVPSGAHAGGQPVAPPAGMNQLFRSVQPSAAPATPEQSFLAQNAQLQRQIANGRGSDGSVINGHGVPLELTSNLLPVMPPGGRLTVNGKTVATPATGSAPPTSSAGTPAPGPTAAATAAAAASAASAASAAATGIIPMAAPTAGPAGSNGIAQKMMDALAKYQQLKQQEDQQNSTETGTPAKVDLAL